MWPPPQLRHGVSVPPPRKVPCAPCQARPHAPRESAVPIHRGRPPAPLLSRNRSVPRVQAPRVAFVTVVSPRALLRRERAIALTFPLLLDMGVTPSWGEAATSVTHRLCRGTALRAAAGSCDEWMLAVTRHRHAVVTSGCSAPRSRRLCVSDQRAASPAAGGSAL